MNFVNLASRSDLDIVVAGGDRVEDSRGRGLVGGEQPCRDERPCWTIGSFVIANKDCLH